MAIWVSLFHFVSSPDPTSNSRQLVVSRFAEMTNGAWPVVSAISLYECLALTNSFRKWIIRFTAIVVMQIGDGLSPLLSRVSKSFFEDQRANRVENFQSG